MNNYDDKYLSDEIDLRELFSRLWKGKIYIILFGFLFVFFASLYLQSAVRTYTIEYNLKPVGDEQKKPSLGGLDGFASLAGIQLPSSSSNDFVIFKELISSVEVSRKIFRNKELIRSIFSSEWDESLNTFSGPQKSKIQINLSKIKKILTGNKDTVYIPPNPKRLAMFISSNYQINQDKKTGFLNITTETNKPNLLLSLIIEATAAADDIMRQRYIEFSTDPLAFYKQKIQTARSREHRESLAELISSEEQKLMFASKGKYFIAEPYIDAKVSLYPTAPKPKLVLIVSLFAGLISGAGIILMLSGIGKDR
jgi:hypothetical protein